MEPRRPVKGKRTGTAESGPRDAGRVRIGRIDCIKGLAVIAVILIHTMSASALAVTGAPYHIWQAVPVFLLIAGFTGTFAYRRRADQDVATLYDFGLLSRRFRRILIPFTAIWVFQLAVLTIFMKEAFHDFSPYLVGIPATAPGALLSYLQGAYGPGSYFVPVILQQVLLLPLFYYLAVRSPDGMILAAFFLDLVLEFAVAMLGVAPAVYSVLYIRYIAAGALGVWLALRAERPYPWLVAGALVSLWYITAVYYFGFQFWFLPAEWSFFHAFSYFWTLALVVAGFALLPERPSEMAGKFLAETGKASWHIFLVQMTYFFLWPTFGDWIDIPLAALAGNPGLHVTCQIVSYSLMNLAVCIPAGYCFYRINELLLPTRRDSESGNVN